ncbi:MAG: putative capsular polysaccharide synthesis family protein [Eubacteriales bacterium]
MIRISNRIDETLSIYRNNKIVVWGCGTYGKRIYGILQYFNIDIYAYCDNKEVLWGTIEPNSGVPIISPVELKELIRESQNVVVQIGCVTQDNGLMEQIHGLMGGDYISLQEARCMLELLRTEHAYQTSGNELVTLQSAEMQVRGQVSQQVNNYLCEESGDNALIICAPPKTGNVTLSRTLNMKEVKCVNVRHIPSMMDIILSDDTYRTVKVLVGIREPIGQNLSLLYQFLSNTSNLVYTALLACHQNRKLLYKGGGDVQQIFTHWLEALGYMQDNKATNNQDRILTDLIQSFIPEFQEQVLDIMQVPFDKDKGYSIIREGRLEVFIYQLEKMNEVVKPLSDFVGTSFTEWVRVNEASEKWIADSYKQAQQELKFSQEYFDKCYNEPYVKHFYSEADIEKFKTKWYKNIL